MPPLPENSTACVFIDYEVAGYPHTAQVRFDAPNTPSDVLVEFASIVTALGPNLYESHLLGTRYRVAGGTVSVPFPSTGLPAVWGVGLAVGDETARYYDWIGRSTGGKRVRFSLFGATILTNDNKYRITSTIGPPWSEVQDILDAAEGTFLAIDGLQPVWYPYVNLGVNAYWRNKVR